MVAESVPGGVRGVTLNVVQNSCSLCQAVLIAVFYILLWRVCQARDTTPAKTRNLNKRRKIEMYQVYIRCNYCAHASKVMEGSQVETGKTRV